MQNHVSRALRPAKAFFQSLWKQFSCRICPRDQASDRRANHKVHVNMHKDSLQIIYINAKDVITNYYYIKGTVTPPALILLIKQHGHKAKGVHRLLSAVNGSCFISGRSLDVIIKMQVGPQCPDCVRAISCPSQFLSSVRLVFPCSCLSQTCSDIHSRSCWTRELSATRCFWRESNALGNPEGGWRAGKQLAIDLLQGWTRLISSSCVEAAARNHFFNEAPSHCSLLEGGLEGGGWTGQFLRGFCCYSVSSASLFINDRMHDILQGQKCVKWYKWERRASRRVLWKKWNLSELLHLFSATFFAWIFQPGLLALLLLPRSWRGCFF